ncbi:hypothetical protein N0V92_006298 [Colletotrichum tropicale]|nr:hypothetical protein N0V92_006298 [Colletotrichum tropicale]
MEKMVRIQERTINGKPLHTTKVLDYPAEDRRYIERMREAWENNTFGHFSKRSQRIVNELAVDPARGGPIVDEYHADGCKLWYVAKLESGRHGRILAETKLGQFLLDAARLYETMAMYRDQELLEGYLHHDPPLHPRRTLDQSFYWALKTGEALDQDQVLYRGTIVDNINLHRFREERKKNCPGPKNCINKKTIAERILQPLAPDRYQSCNHQPTKVGNFKWDNHSEITAVDGCDHCGNEIRKVPRVVMVDQLWMWILDEKTILTSFPQQYGSDRKGASEVHESVRMRIKNAQSNEIRSVFDVAIIILDECSNNLFDLAKTPAQVIEVLGEAIDRLTNLQTVALAHVRYWTKRADQSYLTESENADVADVQLQLLSINYEAELQWEIGDIIDELNMMIKINHKQNEMIKTFIKHVESIFDTRSKCVDESLRSNEGTRSGKARCRSSSKDAKFSWFQKRANKLVVKVSDRVLQLEDLRNRAEITAQKVS